MKTLLIIPLLSLILCVSCSPVGDFYGTKAVIIHKEQSPTDREKKQAQYTIYFDNPSYGNLKFIFSENFGEVGDIIVGENRGKLIAKPKAIRIEDEK
jgi:hypothetical protein